MQNYRNGKWVDQILSQRREDGLWGNFHTLSCPVPGYGAARKAGGVQTACED